MLYDAVCHANLQSVIRYPYPIRIRGIVENDIRIYPYPQKFTDIRKCLSAVPYPRTSATDYSLRWTSLHDLFALRSSFDVCLCRTWRASYIVWWTWTQERGCDLRRRLPLSHHLRVVRRLVTASSSSLRRAPRTLCHPSINQSISFFIRRLWQTQRRYMSNIV